jgi:hypothetical protein
MIHHTKLLELLEVERERAQRIAMCAEMEIALADDAVKTTVKSVRYWRKRAIDAETRCERLIAER